MKSMELNWGGEGLGGQANKPSMGRVRIFSGTTTGSPSSTVYVDVCNVNTSVMVKFKALYGGKTYRIWREN